MRVPSYVIHISKTFNASYFYIHSVKIGSMRRVHPSDEKEF